MSGCRIKIGWNIDNFGGKRNQVGVINMANKLIFLAVVLLALLISWGDGKRSRKIEKKIPADDTPSCDFFETLIYCYYLEAPDMDLLAQILLNVSETVQSFDVELISCNGPEVPLGIFAPYNISNLYLDNCGFPTMPYDLVSTIESQLLELNIDENEFTLLEAKAPEMLLPFSEYLVELVVAEAGIQTMDVDFLDQYTNLRILLLSDNILQKIGLELLNKDVLTEVTYAFNNLSTIESGAFRDLKNLRSLNLEYNYISNLQEDAFLGLETSPINEIHLDANPFNCTCDLQWLKDWLNERNLTGFSGAHCATPVVGYFDEVQFC